MIYPKMQITAQPQAAQISGYGLLKVHKKPVWFLSLLINDEMKMNLYREKRKRKAQREKVLVIW